MISTLILLTSALSPVEAFQQTRSPLTLRPANYNLSLSMRPSLASVTSIAEISQSCSLRSRLTRPRYSTSAAATTTTSLCSTGSAVAALTVSALAGTVADRFNLLGGGSGTLVSLVFASLMSNLGLAPASHPLYDVCWTKLLPASLALMLISGFDIENESDRNGPSKSDSIQIKQSISAVSVPFVIGSIGSILGCLLSFVLSLFATNVGRWSLPPIEAAVAAGCLCSSYIGGTVNLFATARIVGQSLGGSAGSGINLGSLLSSMAAADLLVMALYFSAMAAAFKSKLLQRIFPGRKKENEATEENQVLLLDPKADAARAPVAGTKLATEESSSSGERRIHSVTAIAVASTLAFGIVCASDNFERNLAQRYGVPGMGCAAIAVLSTVVRWTLQRVKLVQSSTFGLDTQINIRTIFPPLWLQKEMDRACPRLSGLCFNLLFAAIGTSANVAVALRHGPASFLFAVVALSIHVAIILFGSWGAMKLFPAFKIFPLAVEDVMVASNAGIGGPATAAAFAGSVGSTCHKKKSSNRGLVLAATVLGVVGYALGTSVGVGLSGMLLEFVLAEGFWEMPMHP